MLLTFPGHKQTRRQLLLRQSMRAWGDCLPDQPSQWIGSDCGRVLLRSMTLDWLCDNGRGGREWLVAVGVGLDTWRNTVGSKDAVLDLPGSPWTMGVVNGLPRIRPNMRAEDEDAEREVVRLGMCQWEDSIAIIPDAHIDIVAHSAMAMADGPGASSLVDQNIELKIPHAMTLASVAIMGMAVMRVVGLDQLAIVGGNRDEPWHGHLGNLAQR